jgi:hypothetical protein
MVCFPTIPEIFNFENCRTIDVLSEYDRRRVIEQCVDILSKSRHILKYNYYLSIFSLIPNYNPTLNKTNISNLHSATDMSTLNLTLLGTIFVRWAIDLTLLGFVFFFEAGWLV